MGNGNRKDGNPKRQGTLLSRREVLKMGAAGGLGLLLGSMVGGSVIAGKGLAASLTKGFDSRPTGDDQESVPFYGKVQAGIVTPAQNFLIFASFDLVTERIEDVRKLFQDWTDAAARLTEGKPVGEESDNAFLPPKDTGEAAGLLPARTTVTFGVGPSVFDGRFGLKSKRPPTFADLPSFPGESLQPQWCGGDIGVQVCSNDMQVAFHAIRNLIRIARGKAVLRWMQEGFQRSGAADPQAGTPRNLLGFKDGTGNPDVNDPDLMNRYVWVQKADGPSWMENGTYMVVRKIRMRIEVWDRSSLQDQEATFGRHRASGAPLGRQDEFDSLEEALEQKNADGTYVIPVQSHVRLSHGDGSVKILRRSYSYSSGIEPRSGQLDAGLFFICFQRDIASQFVPLQDRLARQDKLNEYIVHIGSAVFACFPGVSRGGYIGEGLWS